MNASFFGRQGRRVFLFSETQVVQIPFHSLWKIIRLVLAIQIFNVVMDYFMWVSYNYSVPSFTIATLTVFYTVLILAIKVAMDRENTTPR